MSQSELLKAARRRESNSLQSPLLQILSPELFAESQNKLRDSMEDICSADGHQKEDGSEVLFIDNKDSVTYAHFGYIYCLLLISLNDQLLLISGCESHCTLYALRKVVICLNEYNNCDFQRVTRPSRFGRLILKRAH
jgi:hypothetical protein